MNQIFCIHTSVGGHLDCFQLPTIINKAAMNIVEHVSLLYGKASFGYMSRSVIAVSLGITISSLLRNYQSDCRSFKSHKQ